MLLLWRSQGGRYKHERLHPFLRNIPGVYWISRLNGIFGFEVGQLIKRVKRCQKKGRPSELGVWGGGFERMAADGCPMSEISMMRLWAVRN